MAALLLGAEKIETEPHAPKDAKDHPEIHGHDVNHVHHVCQAVDEIVEKQLNFVLPVVGVGVLAVLQS